MAELERSEGEGVAWNFLRVFSPDADKDSGPEIRAIDALRRGELSSWQLVLWSRDLAWLRRDPAFQDFLRDSGILDYWRKYGLLSQCYMQEIMRFVSKDEKMKRIFQAANRKNALLV